MTIKDNVKVETTTRSWSERRHVCARVLLIE